MKTKIATVLFFLCVLVLAADARAASEPVRLKIIYFVIHRRLHAALAGGGRKIGAQVRSGIRSRVRWLVLVVVEDGDFQAAGVDPQEVVDMSFVKQVETSAAVK